MGMMIILEQISTSREHIDSLRNTQALETDRRKRALMEVEIIDAEDKLFEQIRQLNTGETYLVSDLSTYVSDRLGVKFTSSRINEILVDAGLQVRIPHPHRPNQMIYQMSEIATDYTLGVAHMAGGIPVSVRWHSSMIDYLCEYIQKEGYNA